MPTVIEQETEIRPFGPDELSERLTEDIDDLKESLKGPLNGKIISMMVRYLNPREENQPPEEYSFLLTHLVKVVYNQEKNCFTIIHKRRFKDTDLEEIDIPIDKPMCFLFKPQTLTQLPLYVSGKDDIHQFRKI